MSLPHHPEQHRCPADVIPSASVRHRCRLKTSRSRPPTGAGHAGFRSHRQPSSRPVTAPGPNGKRHQPPRPRPPQVHPSPTTTATDPSAVKRNPAEAQRPATEATRQQIPSSPSPAATATVAADEVARPKDCYGMIDPEARVTGIGVVASTGSLVPRRSAATCGQRQGQAGGQRVRPAAGQQMPEADDHPGGQRIRSAAE